MLNLQVTFLKLQMLELVNVYRKTSKFKATWRNFMYEKGVGAMHGKVAVTVTRLQKLTGSLKEDLKDLDGELTESLLRDVLVSVAD